MVWGGIEVGRVKFVCEKDKRVGVTGEYTVVWGIAGYGMYVCYVWMYVYS